MGVHIQSLPQDLRESDAAMSSQRALHTHADRLALADFLFDELLGLLQHVPVARQAHQLLLQNFITTIRRVSSIDSPARSCQGRNTLSQIDPQICVWLVGVQSATGSDVAASRLHANGLARPCCHSWVWGGPSATLGAPTNVPDPGPAPPGSVRVDGAPDTAWDQRLFIAARPGTVQSSGRFRHIAPSRPIA